MCQLRTITIELAPPRPVGLAKWPILSEYLLAMTSTYLDERCP